MTRDISQMVGIGPGDHVGWKWPNKTMKRKGLRCLVLYLFGILLQACSVGTTSLIMPKRKWSGKGETVSPKSLREEGLGLEPRVTTFPRAPSAGWQRPQMR